MERNSLEQAMLQAMNRRQLMRRIGGTGVALALPGALAACGGGSSQSTPTGVAGKRGGTLRFARNLEPLTFDPVLIAENGSEWIVYQIFEQLTAIKRDSSGIEPGLAESWDISADKKTYTFHLRPGVKFSDGSPVTVDDVVFSLRRVANPKGSGYAFLFASVPTPYTQSIKVVGPRSVQVVLSEPLAPFLEFLNVFTTSILPKKYFEENPSRFAQQPIGTGPFKLAQFVKGQYTKLVRNDLYWKPNTPLLDEVIISYVPDDNSRVLELQSGQVDAIADVPYAEIDSLNQQPNIRVQLEPTGRLDAIWLNNKTPPFNDKNIRRALNFATDKEAIVKDVLFGKAQVANHMMPKMRFWDPKVQPYPYDLDMAKHLIGQSAMPNGFQVSLITYADTNVQQVAQTVKESWGKIGVDVAITNLDVGTAFTDFAQGSYHAGGNWFITTDCTAPEELAGLEFDYTGGGTFSFFTWYDDPRANQQYNAAAHATNDKARAAALAALQRTVMDDAPLVTLYFSPARTGLRSNVQNFKTNVSSWWFLDQVSLA